MSFQDMAWAVGKKCANPGQKLVLLMLANRTNGHTGQCNPSHKLLADECSMGVSTLKSHLLALESAGYLKIIHKSMEGVSLPNQYQLIIDQGVGQILAGVGQDLTEGGAGIDRGVGQILATKQEVKPRKEPVIPNTSAAAPVLVKPAAASPLEKPDGVNDKVWADFIVLRKSKKATLTTTALSGIQREADHAGWTLEKALVECCTRGWASFKADWIKPAGKPALITSASRQNETFKERDARNSRARYEEMTGRTHPDNLPVDVISTGFTSNANLLEITHD